MMNYLFTKNIYCRVRKLQMTFIDRYITESNITDSYHRRRYIETHFPLLPTFDKLGTPSLYMAPLVIAF